MTLDAEPAASRLLEAARAGDQAGAEAALRELARTAVENGLSIATLHRLVRKLEKDLGPEHRELLAGALEAGAGEYVRALGEERDADHDVALMALQSSEQRFERLSNSGLLGLFVADLNGKIYEANDALVAMVGYSREEILTGAVRWTSMTPPEWRAADEVAFRQLRTSGAARLYEKEYIRKDGSRVPLLIGAAMIDDQLCIAFALDNSARKQLEHAQRDAVELEAQNRRIQQVNRLKNEFLANMSHELRTPLNAILGFGELLHDGEAGPLEEQQQEFVRTIVGAGKNLLRLINDVLDLVRVEAGKLEFRPEPLDLAAIFREALTIVQGSAAAKRIRLSSTVDPSAKEGIVLDPVRLKQVLYGYLSNAVKFTPEGGAVSVRAAAEGANELRIEVEDSGVGVAPEELPGLFSELRQLEGGSAKRHGGIGLGLVLTRRIVEAQGGRVEARSAPGRGSVFSAILPRIAVPAQPTPRPGRADVRGTSVLVIDDDPRDQVMLVEALEEAGYSAQVAARGAEALVLCSARRFDAITLDLLLPDMSGIDLLARIRKQGLNRDTPVLVVSVAADSAVGFAVNDVLSKPVAPQALLASLRAAGVQPGQASDIMVVDDDPSSLRLMSIALKQLGYQATCFEDGEAGLRAAEQTPPKAVVLDLLMPGIDGFQFLERLRAAPATRKTPVLVWTTKDLSNEELARLNRSAQGIVPKGREGVRALLEDLKRFTAIRPLPASSATP